jgi:hypothetical protein
MTIKSAEDRELPAKIEIDLLGWEGNAFVLLGYAKRLCEIYEKDFGPIRTRMMAGDYETLIKVFDEEFGDYADLYR